MNLDGGIVPILRKAANSGTVLTGKGSASYISPVSLDAAADLIISLRSQLAELQTEIDQRNLAGDFTLVYTSLASSKGDNRRLKAENKRLKKELAESQRRERAAVENMKEAATTSEKLCKWCKFRGEAQRCASCWRYTGRIENDWKKDLFEWRGVQEENSD